MSDEHWSLKQELTRIRGVSDTLCTAHSALSERFARLALILDVTILLIATWLVALAFVDPAISLILTPFALDPGLWAGLLAAFVMALSIIQIKVDWKGSADAHKRSLDIYAEVKREAGYLLASDGALEEQDCQRVLARYDMASAIGVEISSKQFLRQKRRHRIKIEISRHLDSFPATSIWLLRLKIWKRDNLDGGTRDDTQS